MTGLAALQLNHVDLAKETAILTVSVLATWCVGRTTVTSSEPPFLDWIAVWKPGWKHLQQLLILPTCTRLLVHDREEEIWKIPG